MNRECPACGSNETKRKGSKWDFDFVLCQKCGTLFTAELPKTGDGQDYDDYGYGNEQLIPQFIDKRCDELILPFDAYRQNNKFLDVGFGAGTIIRAAARNGWRVSGVELSKSAVVSLAAKHPDFDLFCGSLELRGFESNSFDAVAVVEVIEHVPDPSAILHEIIRVLRPGGIAWVTTPNLNSLSSRLLGLSWSMVAPPDHLEIYSVTGVRKLLMNNGFKIKMIQTYGLNFYEIVNYFRRGRKEIDVAERLQSGYGLNESLESRKIGRIAKQVINKSLNLAKLGDGIKIWAEKVNTD